MSDFNLAQFSPLKPQKTSSSQRRASRDRQQKRKRRSSLNSRNQLRAQIFVQPQDSDVDSEISNQSLSIGSSSRVTYNSDDLSSVRSDETRESHDSSVFGMLLSDVLHTANTNITDNKTKRLLCKFCNSATSFVDDLISLRKHLLPLSSDGTTNYQSFLESRVPSTISEVVSCLNELAPIVYGHGEASWHQDPGKLLRLFGIATDEDCSQDGASLPTTISACEEIQDLEVMSLLDETDELNVTVKAEPSNSITVLPTISKVYSLSEDCKTDVFESTHVQTTFVSENHKETQDTSSIDASKNDRRVVKTDGTSLSSVAQCQITNNNFVKSHSESEVTSNFHQTIARKASAEGHHRTGPLTSSESYQEHRHADDNNDIRNIIASIPDVSKLKTTLLPEPQNIVKQNSAICRSIVHPSTTSHKSRKKYIKRVVSKSQKAKIEDKSEAMTRKIHALTKHLKKKIRQDSPVQTYKKTNKSKRKSYKPLASSMQESPTWSKRVNVIPHLNNVCFKRECTELEKIKEHKTEKVDDNKVLYSQVIDTLLKTQNGQELDDNKVPYSQVMDTFLKTQKGQEPSKTESRPQDVRESASHLSTDTASTIGYEDQSGCVFNENGNGSGDAHLVGAKKLRSPRVLEASAASSSAVEESAKANNGNDPKRQKVHDNSVDMNLASSRPSEDTKESCNGAVDRVKMSERYGPCSHVQPIPFSSEDRIIQKVQNAMKKDKTDSNLSVYRISKKNSLGMHQDKQIQGWLVHIPCDYHQNAIRSSHETTAPVNRYSMLECDNATKCFSILHPVYNLSSAYPFHTDISCNKDPVYHEIIKFPMCLDTIAYKLSNGLYEIVQEFVKDMRLIFWNCKRYFKNMPAVMECCYTVEATFEQCLRQILPDFDFSEISGAPCVPIVTNPSFCPRVASQRGHNTDRRMVEHSTRFN